MAVDTFGTMLANRDGQSGGYIGQWVERHLATVYSERDDETSPPFNASHVDVDLDIGRRSLTLFDDTGQRLAHFSGVKGRVLYPCVWFHKRAVLPVRIEYLEGPTGASITPLRGRGVGEPS